MASIDYQGAKQEIERIIENSASKRTIVFWYDPAKNFADDIKDDSFSNCKVLICDHNEFEIKKTIEHDDLASNFLVYVPSERPADNDNWLLYILMYSKEYYADTVALTMRRLGITNNDLRKVIEQHIKFFDSDVRVKKLSDYISVNDETRSSDLRLALMAALVKSEKKSIDSVLAELVFDKDGTKYKELVKYRLEDYFWNDVSEAFNYEGEQRIDILSKRFVFSTYAEQVYGQGSGMNDSVDSLSSFYKQYLVPEKGLNDAKFFIDSIKGDERYRDFQARMADELRIEALIGTKDITSIQGADVFECLDLEIIKKICDSLINGSLEFDFFERIIMNRVNSMWHESLKHEYGFLLSSIRLLRQVDKGIPLGLTANEYIEKYVGELYKIDTEYRRAITSYKRIGEPSDDFETLIGIVERTYQTRFLDVLGNEYSKALEQQGKWEFVGQTGSDEFYSQIQKNPTKKMFVIISDALRYEIGEELCERIKSNKILKGGAEIEHMVSPLPSITSFGMASLLPHRNISFSNGQVMVDGMTTNGVAARDAVLKARNLAYAAISYDDISTMTQKEIRKYCSDKTLIYIYHDVMDNAGEHSESKVFDVTETCIDELITLVKKLYNNLQISNFYITADHGFLYRRNEIEPQNKYSNITSLNAIETSKRYVLTDDESLSVPYCLEFRLSKVSGGDYKYIAPWGYDLFKTPGGGIQYVHGGPSLQETVVPLIHVSELRSDKLKQNVKPVEVRLKTITRKITNRSFSLEFEQMEKVEENKQAITCETYIEDDKGEIVSGRYSFIANSTTDDPETRIMKIRFTLKNILFDRNKPYYLVLKSIEKPDEFIERETFAIDIIQFKIF